jgi:hypothetical protein
MTSIFQSRGPGQSICASEVGAFVIRNSEYER